jgi:hypothetical protein
LHVLQQVHPVALVGRGQRRELGVDGIAPDLARDEKQGGPVPDRLGQGDDVVRRRSQRQAGDPRLAIPGEQIPLPLGGRFRRQRAEHVGSQLFPHRGGQRQAVRSVRHGDQQHVEQAGAVE